MSTKTNCDKCIFADHADSGQPCAMNIIEKINGIKTITIENNFNSILHYKCPMAFSMNIYRDNIAEIGTINDLKSKLINNAIIKYYMVIFLDENFLENVCLSIQNLDILPKFISFIVNENNNTANLLNKFRDAIPKNITWKLHNLLENMSYQDILNTIFDTNNQKNNIPYFWINTSDTYSTWNNNIKNINDIIIYEQPFLHALFRSKKNDGMFLTFNNYYSILDLDKTNINSAIQKIENPLIRYYG